QLEERGFQVLPSAANFVFITHPELAAKEIYDSLRRKQIFIRYFGKQPIENYVRISMGTDEEMKRFFYYLDELLYTYFFSFRKKALARRLITSCKSFNL